MPQIKKEVIAVTEQIFDTPAYTRSRRAYTLECAFEYFVTLLTSGTFLATLLTSMNVDDAATGVISSLISFAYLFQLLSIFIVQKIRNVKRVAVPVHFIGQLFFLILYLIPFFDIPQGIRTVLIVGCIMAGFCCRYLVTSVIFNWGNAYVNPAKRASFAATKEIISLLSGIVISLSMGYSLDKFIESNNVNGGFIVITIMILVMSICDFTCLMIMKNQKREAKSKNDSEPFWQVIKKLFRNKGFVSTVVIHSLHSFALYMTSGFMSTYRLKELAITVAVVETIHIVAQLFRAAFSKPFARYADKHSYAKGITLGTTLFALSFLINVFTAPKTWWLVIIFTIMLDVSYAGTSQNLLNIPYSYIDRKYFVEASAIKASISGLCGFGASLIGSAILEAIQENGNTLFGIHVYGQQVLSAISFVIAVIGILFVKFVLEKQKIIAK